MRIAIFGGTGDLGRGLAINFAAAGHEIVVGSRSQERADQAAATLKEAFPEGSFTPLENVEAAEAGELAVVSIPHEGIEATIPPMAEALAGKVVVSVVNAMRWGKTGAIALQEEALGLREDAFPCVVAAVLTALGRLREAEGRPADARRLFEEGLALGEEIEDPGAIVTAVCHLALLPGDDGAEAPAVFDRHESRLGVGTKAGARYRLWRLTGDPAHLGESRSLLRHLRDHAPEEYRESMVENHPLHLAIAAEREEHGA